MLAYETGALATKAEAEAFEIPTEARPSRGTIAPREGLETEASRPRPHPWVDLHRSQKCKISMIPTNGHLFSVSGQNVMTSRRADEQNVVRDPADL